MQTQAKLDFSYNDENVFKIDLPLKVIELIIFNLQNVDIKEYTCSQLNQLTMLLIYLKKQL